MNIYVGNLSFQLSEDDLNSAFGEYGQVDSAKIITDRETGRSKGFIEMPNQEEAEKAIEGLNGKELEGRAVKVNESKPREDRPRRPRY